MEINLPKSFLVCARGTVLPIFEPRGRNPSQWGGGVHSPHHSSEPGTHAVNTKATLAATPPSSPLWALTLGAAGTGQLQAFCGSRGTEGGSAGSQLSEAALVSTWNPLARVCAPFPRAPSFL